MIEFHMILTPPPTALTAFIGRATDRTALTAMRAGSTRLICLMGPGGMGKSRLAAEVLKGRADVAWCALDRARSAEDLRAGVAAINARHADADFCVLAGDLADLGDTEAYERLKDCLADLSVPLHITIVLIVTEN